MYIDWSWETTLITLFFFFMRMISNLKKPGYHYWLWSNPSWVKDKLVLFTGHEVPASPHGSWGWRKSSELLVENYLKDELIRHFEKFRTLQQVQVMLLYITIFLISSQFWMGGGQSATLLATFLNRSTYRPLRARISYVHSYLWLIWQRTNIQKLSWFCAKWVISKNGQSQFWL